MLLCSFFAYSSRSTQRVPAHAWVRIRRPKIDKLACQAQDARIFAPRNSRKSSNIITLFFFGLLVKIDTAYL